jgi:hypothetical protein
MDPILLRIVDRLQQKKMEEIKELVILFHIKERLRL